MHITFHSINFRAFGKYYKHWLNEDDNSNLMGQKFVPQFCEEIKKMNIDHLYFRRQYKNRSLALA